MSDGVVPTRSGPSTPPYTEATIPIEARAVMARLDLATRALPRDLQARVFVLAGELYETGVAAGRARAAADIRAQTMDFCMDGVGRHLVAECARIAAGAEGGGEADHQKALQDRVWWLHRCGRYRAWFTDPLPPGTPRPEICGGCHSALNDWYQASRVPLRKVTARSEVSGLSGPTPKDR